MKNWGYLAVGVGAAIAGMLAIDYGATRLVKNVQMSVQERDGYKLELLIVPGTQKPGYHQQLVASVTKNGQAVQGMNVELDVGNGKASLKQTIVTGANGQAATDLLSNKAQTLNIAAVITLPGGKTLKSRASAIWKNCRKCSQAS